MYDYIGVYFLELVIKVRKLYNGFFYSLIIIIVQVYLTILRLVLRIGVTPPNLLLEDVDILLLPARCVQVILFTA